MFVMATVNDQQFCLEGLRAPPPTFAHSPDCGCASSTRDVSEERSPPSSACAGSGGGSSSFRCSCATPALLPSCWLSASWSLNTRRSFGRTRTAMVRHTMKNINTGNSSCVPSGSNGAVTARVRVKGLSVLRGLELKQSSPRQLLFKKLFGQQNQAGDTT